MLEELKEERIIAKVGGRFRLSALIQKRMVALNRGAKPLTDIRSSDLMEVAIHEILQDKIFLDSSGIVREVTGEEVAETPADTQDK